jgi:hypothetical protein
MRIFEDRFGAFLYKPNMKGGDVSIAAFHVSYGF